MTHTIYLSPTMDGDIVLHCMGCDWETYTVSNDLSDVNEAAQTHPTF